MNTAKAIVDEFFAKSRIPCPTRLEKIIQRYLDQVVPKETLSLEVRDKDQIECIRRLREIGERDRREIEQLKRNAANKPKGWGE